MEFSFDINQLFPERVSILDQNLVVESRKTAGRPDLLASIATVIDALGVASAKAQQLTAPITSASKLQFQKHQLYLLKEEKSNGGRGVVVGFLKVGYKKLFLLDRQGVHIEAEPLCVLDFYISEKCQRHGYGLELFDFMLQHKNLEPVLMAYDRPSPKFLSFLSKHYSLSQSVPQVNNFVVFEGFFLNRTAAQVRKVPLKKQHGEIKPYSLTEREVVHQEQRARPWPFVSPDSSQQSVSSQCSHSLSTASPPCRVPPHVTPASDPGSNREQNTQCPRIEHCRARRTSQHDLVARRSLYSRHLDSRAVGQLDRHLQDKFQSSSPLFPPLPSSKNDICTKTFLNSSRDTFLNTDAQSSGADSFQCSTGHMTLRNLLEDNDRGQKDWSWTIGGNCRTAQWVKQKHNSKTYWPW